MAEAARQELRELVDLLDDARIHNAVLARDSLLELVYLLHEIADTLGELVAEGGADQASDALKRRCHHVMEAYQERISYQGPRANLPLAADD